MVLHRNMKIDEIKNVAGLEDLITKVSTLLVSFGFIKPKLESTLTEINAGTFNVESLSFVNYPENLTGRERDFAEQFTGSLYTYMKPF